MKKIILPIVLCCVAVTFAQNRSNGAVATSIPPTPANPIFGETFRFNAGLVTQLDAGTGFGFINDRWFSIGQFNTPSQTVYGLRFQLPNRAITMGYQDINDANPRIQWIGDGSFSGTDLQFRVADSFTSTSSRIVATMTDEGKTYFGIPFTPADETLVGMDYSSISTSNRTGLTLQNTNGASGTVVGLKSINNAPSQEKIGIEILSNGGSFFNTGMHIELDQGYNSLGVVANVIANGGDTYGVRSAISSNSPTNAFGAAIYGSASTNPNWYAGYFNGDVVVTGIFTSSDKKLKEEIKDEENILEKVMELNAVTYKFKKNDQLNLSDKLQHGFIAQDIEEVFPELVTTIRKPIYNNENKLIDTYEYKAVNYIGVISILTSSIQELNEKIQTLENEKRNGGNTSDTIIDERVETFSMEQNIPNPFNNVASIRYIIPNTTKANITIFDMTGKYIKEYDISNGKGKLEINSDDIGKGMFLYSLISGGKIIMTKKMIVK